MAIAQQRRRQVERAATDAALQRIDESEFVIAWFAARKFLRLDCIIIQRLALESFSPAKFDSPAKFESTSTGTGTGIVGFVDEKRGYGFVFGDDEEPKVFVHLSAVREAGLTGSL